MDTSGGQGGGETTTEYSGALSDTMQGLTNIQKQVSCQMSFLYLDLETLTKEQWARSISGTPPPPVPP